MKLLLTTLNAKYIHTNLAIRLLYELNEDHEGLEWKEFNIKEDKDEVARHCATFEVVAFSCYIWNITQTLAVAEKIKVLNPQTKILLGGPEVSYEFEDVISLNHVDYIIVGEGETAFNEFLSSFPKVEQVSSLVWKDGVEVKQNKMAPMFDLKNFQNSMPYRFDNPAVLANKVLYIETSRGCPYKCEFCLASLDNKVRYLPNDSIKATLLYMMQHGKVIKFLDRTFNIKKDFTLDIFKFILENYRPENVFQFEITADILHPDIIQFIHDHVPDNLFRFEIGIQTVNQKANLLVSRKQSFEKTTSIIKQLDYKVEMHLDLIVGMALDHWEDIRFSIEEVFKLFAPEMQLGFLKFLKGTPVRKKHAEHGFKFDPMPPYQIIESNYLSKDQLRQIVELEHALEIYWNGKKAVNTLKYVTHHYSIFEFLLGLGHFFGTQKDFHKYSLTDVFEIITAYSKQAFPNDAILQQLIAVDYYLHFKVKPKNLFLEEMEFTSKNKLIDQLKLNHHKYRYVVLPLDFDFKLFANEQTIKNENKHLIIQYNGTSKAEVV
ncbi:MAG: cobalamin-binding protein [Bacteroidetes bacterium]|nr:cobalamin-binding protein [Bacteroidota bacterium]